MKLPLVKKFSHAFRGIGLSFRDKSCRIVWGCAFLSLLVAIYFGFHPLELALVVFCCGLVLGLELVNTAIEKLADRVCDQPDQQIKNVKDLAAGATLLASITSLIILLLILIRKEG